MSRAQRVAGPVWAALQKQRQPVSLGVLADSLRLNPASVRSAVWRFEQAGLVERTASGRSTTPRQILKVAMTDKAEGFSAAPRVTQRGEITAARKTSQQRIWSAIRVLKRFDRRTVEYTSEQSRQNVEHYLNCLQRAGYVRRVRAYNPLTGALAEYQLVANTGLKAPSVTQGRREGAYFRHLVDPNTGVTHDISPRSAPSKKRGE
jgi:hypothetical protein